MGFLHQRSAAWAATSAWLIAAGAASAQTPPTPIPSTQPPAAPASGASAVTTALPAITADGALALSKTLADSLSLFTGGQQPGKPGIFINGAPVVMPVGDHYVVALPSASLRGEDQQRLDIPSVQLTVKPLANQAFAITALVPSSLVYMADGDPIAVLTLGEQKISGVWSPPLMSLLSADISLKDLQLTSVYEDYWFGVGSVSYTQDLRPEDGAGNGWGGPSALALTDIRLDKGEDTLASIGGFTAETVYTRLRLDKTAALMAMGQSAAASKTEPTPAALMGLIKGVLGGVSSRVRITDFSAHDSDSETTVTFEQGSFSNGVSDLDRDLAAADFGFEVKGISFEPSPFAEAALPTAADLKLSLRNLPMAKLLQLAETAMGPTPPTGDPSALLLDLADAAKLTIKLESVGAQTAALTGHATGEATANKSAAVGAVGKAKLTLGGVDKLLADLKPKKNAKPDPETADLLGGLTMLKAMGRPEKGKDGKPVLAFTFELTPQGTVLVNDADLAPLLEGGGKQKK